MREEEDRKRKIEFIRLKEWEEKFDEEKRLEEQEEFRREERLKARELRNIDKNDKNEIEISTSTLEKFEIDKTSKN